MRQRDRDEFFVELSRAAPQALRRQVAVIGAGLIRAASMHLRACEGDCSIRPPKGDEGNGMDVRGYWGRMQDRALKLAAKHCPHGWTIGHQNDPRGATLWLQSKGDADADGCLKVFPPATGFPARVFGRA